MSTIRQSIISDAEVKKVIDELLSLPSLIRGAQDSFEETELKLAMFDGDAEAKAKVEDIEGEAYFEVREELNSDGKKKCTNEEQRKAAARLRCNTDPDYIAAIQIVTQAKRKKAELKMELGKKINTIKYLTNQYYGMKSIAGIIEGLAHESIAADDLKRYAGLRAAIKEYEGDQT